MRKITICLVSALALALAACGDDGGTATIDAANTPIDAPAAIDAAIDAPAAVPTCAAYCTTIKANCTMAPSPGPNNRQYVMDSECMASCLGMPVGVSADTSGNTLGCRMYHAGAAGMGPDLAASAATHCVHAGPGGAGACGANCAGFCQIARRACGNTPYASDAACMTACMAFTDTVKYSAPAAGNNLACRLYHATAASVAPVPHCGHIGPTGGPCGAAVQ
jgi:hypothetical protein